jgi:hypothetical protein
VKSRIIAAVAVLAGGLVASATPANAATGPTIVVKQGVVTITGTAALDVISLRTNATELVVDFGLDGTVDAQVPRSQFQRIRALAGAGDDRMSIRGAGEVPVTLNGEVGNDVLTALGSIGETGVDDAPTTLAGGDGNDDLLAATPGLITMLGGAGDDIASGGGAGVGREIVSLGAGNDRFRSSLNAFVGDRLDEVDGGTGQDRMDVEGTFATESVGLPAHKGQLLMEHDFRNKIFADNLEDVSYLGFGGLDVSGSGDAVAVNDLSSTEVRRFTANFSADQSGNTPNNSADTLTVRGTPGVDHIIVTGSKANVLVTGVTPTVSAIFLRPEDFLLIDTLEGDDTVDSSGLEPGLVQLIVR